MKTSHLIKQFEKLKSEYPDAVILLKVDDYYMAFRGDADLVSFICNTTLVRVDQRDYSFTGFQAKHLEDYLDKLIKDGINKVVVASEPF